MVPCERRSRSRLLLEQRLLKRRVDAKIRIGGAALH